MFTSQQLERQNMIENLNIALIFGTVQYRTKSHNDLQEQESKVLSTEHSCEHWSLQLHVAVGQ